MKKSLIIVLAIISIMIIVMVVIIGAVFINLNKEKISITALDFKNTMEQKDYVIIDASNQFSQYDYISQVYIARDSSSNYQIEFYELLDENYATSFYNYNKSIIESSKENASAETSYSLKNYSKYMLYANGKYIGVSKINNTVIYRNVDDEYRETVKDINMRRK